MKSSLRKRAITGNIEYKETKLKDISEIDEMSGKLSSDPEKERLMKSVLENDKEAIEEGKMVIESMNQGLNELTPSAMFEQLVKNFSMAKQIYGEKLLREATGHDSGYMERNIKIPEFQRELRKNIEQRFAKMEEAGIIEENKITERGVELAALVLLGEEMKILQPKGILGELMHKESSIYGIKEGIKDYRKESYRNIAVRSTIKRAVRRSHKNLQKADLMSYERKSKGQHYIIYAIDASASMKGNKIGSCKKAGIALAYKAIDQKDFVGLMVFGSKTRSIIRPTQDFMQIAKEIVKIRAMNETNIAGTIREAIKLFPKEEATKHLIILTDAIPTIGEHPEKETIEAAAEARNAKITISVVGINLDAKGKKLAEKIAEIGEGRFYLIRDVEKIDAIVLEDYYFIQ